jgi:hypothetical protein
MEWLSQNWVWIVVAVGVVWLFARMRPGAGGMGGCCGGHDMAHEGPAQDASKKEAGAQDTKAAAVAATKKHGGGCC